MIEWWYRALHSLCGIKLQSNDVELLRQHLYAARARAEDPELARLSLVLDPFNPNCLWIVHKVVKQDGAQE